jgi:predicted AAA+ superfamily ATPase
MPSLPAIAIEGAKAIGKSATAQRRAATVHQLYDPDQLEIARADPARLLAGDRPVFIDEFQRLPGTWDRVRNAVDAGAPAGSFLLAGSASSDEPRHSGAGRIPVLRMRPLSLAERGLTRPTVSLARLLEGEGLPLEGTTAVALADYSHEIVRGGFPGIRAYEGRALRTQLDGYVERVIDREIPDEAGVAVRRPDALRALMSAYAAATATTTSIEKIRLAAGGRAPLSDRTEKSYRTALTRLWILDPLPGWRPTMSPIGRISAQPRHHLADPALAARLLGATEDSLLQGRGPTGVVIPRDGTLLGGLFESLIALSVRVYAQHCEAKAFHFRTASGEREVDLVVERPDRRFVAIEIKLTTTATDHDCRHLIWLRRRMGDRMLDAIVVTTGREAYRRADGIGVVPAALLGP